MNTQKESHIVQLENNKDIINITNQYNNFLIFIGFFTIIQLSILLTSAIY